MNMILGSRTKLHFSTFQMVKLCDNLRDLVTLAHSHDWGSLSYDTSSYFFSMLVEPHDIDFAKKTCSSVHQF